MYYKVFEKFYNIYTNQYTFDENGKLTGINFDNEAFIT